MVTLLVPSQPQHTISISQIEKKNFSSSIQADDPGQIVNYRQEIIIVEKEEEDKETSS